MGVTVAEFKHQPEPDITPIPLMQLATAFWAFKTLSTAIDMDLFTRLETSPMNPPELARWLNIEERPAEMIHGGSFQPREQRSEEHTSELQSRPHLVCRLLLEKKKKK